MNHKCPVLYFENKVLYKESGEVPEKEDEVPYQIGKARVEREGKDVTIVSYSIGMKNARAAADQLAKDGIEAEVIDLITLSPWDKEIPLSDVKEIVDAYLAVGVTEISLSDASGVAFPSQVYGMCEQMAKEYPQVTWWLHFHNTRGLGVANILAGMQAGFTRFDTSFAGVGGCPFVPGAAGNVASEDVIHMLDEMGVKTGIDLDAAMDVSRRLVAMLGHATDSYLLRAGKSKDLIREIPTKQIKNQTMEKK